MGLNTGSMCRAVSAFVINADPHKSLKSQMGTPYSYIKYATSLQGRDASDLIDLAADTVSWPWLPRTLGTSDPVNNEKIITWVAAG